MLLNGCTILLGVFITLNLLFEIIMLVNDEQHSSAGFFTSLVNRSNVKFDATQTLSAKRNQPQDLFNESLKADAAYTRIKVKKVNGRIRIFSIFIAMCDSVWIFNFVALLTIKGWN